MVFANKQDLSGSMSLEEIRDVSISSVELPSEAALRALDLKVDKDPSDDEDGSHRLNRAVSPC